MDEKTQGTDAAPSQHPTQPRRVSTGRVIRSVEPWWLAMDERYAKEFSGGDDEYDTTDPQSFK